MFSVDYDLLFGMYSVHKRFNNLLMNFMLPTMVFLFCMMSKCKHGTVLLLFAFHEKAVENRTMPRRFFFKERKISTFNDVFFDCYGSKRIC